MRKLLAPLILLCSLSCLAQSRYKPVFYKSSVSNSLSAQEKKQGWKLLFDGSTSNGWVAVGKDHFPATGWEIKDGILKVPSSDGKPGAGGGDIITTTEYSAFDLVFDFNITPGANSGVKYFVEIQKNTPVGLEYQVLDDSLHPDAKLGRNGDRTLGSLYDMIKAEKTSAMVHPPGQWNQGRIVVYPNNHVEHYLNGIKVLEYDRGSQAYKDLVALSKYKIWDHFGEAAKGPILLQDHGNEVSYRNIKIKELH
jgi:hypothetical protein